LDAHKDFPTGSVASELVEHLYFLAIHEPRGQTLGFHNCPFEGCEDVETMSIHTSPQGQKIALGSAEVWVMSTVGGGWIAPNLTAHYVDAHRYLPPADFLRDLAHSLASENEWKRVRRSMRRWIGRSFDR